MGSIVSSYGNRGCTCFVLNRAIVLFFTVMLKASANVAVICQKINKNVHPKIIMARRLHARRLDGVDKNIWVEFTQLAADYKAVNLGQGFPDFSPPGYIQEAFCKA